MRVATKIIAIPVVLSTFLAACGDDDGAETSAETTSTVAGEQAGTSAFDELVSAAQDEGKVVYYTTSTEETNKAVAAGFEEEYGIPVEILRLPSSDLMARFASEQEAGASAADVVGLSTFSFYEDNPEWFVPTDAEAVPSIAEYPESSIGPNWVRTYVAPMTIVYNTDTVAEDAVPKTWDDVLDPDFRDQILLTDPRTSPAYMAWLSVMRDLYGIEWLERLAEQSFDLVDSASPGAQQVAAGAHALNFPGLTVHSGELRSEGVAPIEMVVMEEGNVTPSQDVALVADSAHPNAARLFMNWLASPAGLEAQCSSAEIAVSLPDIEGCIALPPENWIIPDANVANPEELLEALGLPPQ